MIAHQDDGVGHDLIEAFAGIGPVADHIAEAVNGLDRVAADVRQHRVEGFEVAVNVADDGFHGHTPRTGCDAARRGRFACPSIILPVCSANLKESGCSRADKPRRLRKLYRPKRPPRGS